VAEEERKLRERAAKRAARGGRPTKAELAAERRAHAEREASQSVRDIFRKLAGALHPDREADSTQRERKTALMQRVNRAYKRKDLLELLTLQIEIEQIDADQLAQAPEQRLERFNAVLREQSETLAGELEQRIAPFQMFLGMFAGRVTPKSVDKALTERIFEGRTVCKAIARDLEALDDRVRRRAVLDAIPDPDEDLDAFLELAMLFDTGLPAAAGGPTRARRKKKPARNRKRAKKSRR
jgi:curved DNA-binding protein CbpA